MQCKLDSNLLLLNYDREVTINNEEKWDVWKIFPLLPRLDQLPLIWFVRGSEQCKDEWEGVALHEVEVLGRKWGFWGDILACGIGNEYRMSKEMEPVVRCFGRDKCSLDEKRRSRHSRMCAVCWNAVRNDNLLLLCDDEMFWHSFERVCGEESMNDHRLMNRRHRCSLKPFLNSYYIQLPYHSIHEIFIASGSVAHWCWLILTVGELCVQSMGSTREHADSGVIGVIGSQSSSKSKQSSDEAELKLDSEDGLVRGEEPRGYEDERDIGEEHGSLLKRRGDWGRAKRLPDRYHSRAKVLDRE